MKAPLIGPASPSLDRPDYAEAPFEHVYVAHYQKLVVALRLSGAPLEVAEDVAQEAFARTFGRWPTVRAGSNPAGYVYRTAFRLLNKSRRGRRGDGESSTVELSGAFDPDVAQRLDVVAALRRLPERQRACVVLSLYLGLSSEEVAKILRIRASTVRVHVARGRATLKEALLL